MHTMQEDDLSLFHKHWILKHPQDNYGTVYNREDKRITWDRRDSRLYWEIWKGEEFICSSAYDIFTTPIEITVENLLINGEGFRIRVIVLCRIAFEFFAAEGHSIRVYAQPSC